MKPSNQRILVVDDSADTLEVLQRNLSDEGYTTYTAPGAAEAIRLLENTPVDLVITDLKMPRVDGLDLVRHVRENMKNTEVMMITGYASVQGAVEAMKTGAEEYLAKPFTDEELFSAVKRALKKLRLGRYPRADGACTDFAKYGLLGTSDIIREVFSAISKASESSATVVITGESGTGKELVARSIHYSGKRASAPFVPVNCAGIPEGLLESELFGFKKGAFTGAIESRAGFFQTADGGSIFLDEISEMSLAMQAKLLRVLQDKKVVMLGSNNSRAIDVRILAATNKDLHHLVEKGSFREDLFYRINVITIDLPPLRDRGDDVLLLARHFAGQFAEELGKPVPDFSKKALEVLRAYHWPGNIRELQNVIHRLVVMTDSPEIEAPDLPSLMRFSALRDKGVDRTLADVEAEYIRNVLQHVKGNKTKAAAILGIDRKTLRSRLNITESKNP